MWCHQAGENLVSVPPLDEPLVHGGGAGGGMGGVFEAGDELGQLVAGLLLGFASDAAKVVKPRY